jgi:hypothetical protein
MVPTVDRIDSVARLSAIVLLATWLFSRALLYQAAYPTRLVELYSEPWWRVFLLVLVVAAFAWCPRVGVLLGLAVMLYLSDLNTLTK